MIIDSHNHPDWYGHDLKKFLANMKQYKIDKTWLLTWELPETEKYGPIPFSRCVAYVEKEPEKFILGYAPDPRRSDAIDALKSAIDIYGVRVYGELKVRMMFDNPDALRIYRFCGEKGLPVIVHIDYEFAESARYPRPNWWYGGGIEPFERAIQKYPKTIFLGHGPGFWAHISGDDRYNKEAYPTGKVIPGGKIVSMLKQYPNLYCDLSAGSGVNSVKRDPEFGKSFLLEFQDRILYGRDYFDNAHQEFLNGLGLPEKVLQKIYSGNALKLVL